MHWFERLEKKYFKPFLTISNSHSLGVDGHHLLQQQPEEDRMEMTAIPTNEFASFFDFACRDMKDNSLLTGSLAVTLDRSLPMMTRKLSIERHNGTGKGKGLH